MVEILTWKRYDALKARIRELEAELAEEHRQNIRNLARAEKAEKALEVAEAQVYRWSAGQRDTEQRLADSEARVAELEIRLASANKAIEAMLREGEEGARIRAYLETGDASLIGARAEKAECRCPLRCAQPSRNGDGAV